MSKKKKKRPDQPTRELVPFDPRALTGEIPWSLEGLGAVLNHAISLHHTPHDDWNRKKKALTLVSDDGSETRLVFNPDMFENQLMGFLTTSLRSKGLSQTEILSHGWRFMEAMGFLKQNAALLRQEGLVISDPDDGAAILISGALIETLATAQYEGVTLQGPEKEPVRTFHLDRVIAKAKRLDAEQDED